MKRGCELSRGFHPGRVRVKWMKGKEDPKGPNCSPRDRETQRKGMQRPTHLLMYSKDIHSRPAPCQPCAKSEGAVWAKRKP